MTKQPTRPRPNPSRVPATVASFDFAAFLDAVDKRRCEQGLGWYDLAQDLWGQSSVLNAERVDDHPLCGGALSRLPGRGEMSCQYALFLLRWLDRAPEEFLIGPGTHVGDVTLPRLGPGARLRFDLRQLHTALNQQRRDRSLTWAELSHHLACTPSRLTNLQTARQADLALTLRITQWLHHPAATYIHPTHW